MQDQNSHNAPSVNETASAVRSEFEVARNAGATPQIELFLSRVSQCDRDELLQQLIVLELRTHTCPEPLPDPASYRARFPDATSVIDAAFAEFRQTGETSSFAPTETDWHNDRIADRPALGSIDTSASLGD